MVVVLALLGCHHVEVVDREPGVRAPLTAQCDDLDPNRCLLPWPSNTFTTADASTETGLRLAVQKDALTVDDSVDYLDRADGYSRVTGVATAFSGDVDASVLSWDPTASLSADAPLQVIDAQPGDHWAERVPFRMEMVDSDAVGTNLHLLIGRPAQPLEANADHVVVVTDDVAPDEDVPRSVQLALGLVEPEDDDEAALVGYHAPTRKVLEDAGVDPEHVVRVWDFTTRSAGDATFRMHAMMDALGSEVGNLGVEVDSAVVPVDPNIAVIVRGRLTNAPGFLTDDGKLVLDDEGRPQVQGRTAIEFRVEVPAGTGDYHVALYGHGTGGDVTDDSFDSELGGQGIAKVALRFDGWTGTDFVQTLLSFSTFLDGSERSTAGLMQALAGGTVLLTALDPGGILDQTLSADTIAGAANPAAGRHPDTADRAWVGGSMGGTMGAVMVSADPRLRFAVLNVPGAGWTHMVPYSLLYESGMKSVLKDTYGDVLDVQLAMVMGQGSWDEVDGAPWADEALASGGTFLLQESIGDPILPNLGTELLANSLHAQEITPDIEDVAGLTLTPGPVTSGAGLEQFRVPDTGQYDVHGFAARDTPAGDAAKEQILEFLTTAWAGTPTIEHPSLCTDETETGNCDYLGMW